MAWFVCTIAKQSERNWDLCKSVGLWGVSTVNGRLHVARAECGDKLLFWLATKGFLGWAEVVADSRPPRDLSETPWGGGQRRYGLVVPMQIKYECEKPVWLAFENNRQKFTEIPQFALQRGFSQIPDTAARAALSFIKENSTRKKAN